MIRVEPDREGCPRMQEILEETGHLTGSLRSCGGLGCLYWDEYAAGNHVFVVPSSTRVADEDDVRITEAFAYIRTASGDYFRAHSTASRTHERLAMARCDFVAPPPNTSAGIEAISCVNPEPFYVCEGELES